jgi:hypothetical protein
MRIPSQACPWEDLNFQGQALVRGHFTCLATYPRACPRGGDTLRCEFVLCSLRFLGV